MQYSFDKYVWYDWDESAVSGTKIYFREYNNTQVSMDIDEIAGANWTISGTNVGCYGNIEALLNYKLSMLG